MLAKFRHKRIHFLSFYLAVVVILAKMMMPLAHANNVNPNDQSGFFASLCTSNGVVLINLNIGANDDNDSKQAPPANTGSQCPLCSIVEQDSLDFDVPVLANAFEFTENKYVTINLSLPVSVLQKQQSIRAPPYFLSA